MCLETLASGKLYHKVAKHLFRAFLKDLKSDSQDGYNHNRFDHLEGPVLTLIIDDKFNATFIPQDNRVIITDGRETVNSGHPALFDWLGGYLEGLGFQEYVINKGKKQIYLKAGLYDAWVEKMS